MSENETPQSLSAKVRALEHKYFSDTVAKLVTSNKN
jgi:folate-dependent phosphoribosylglycinamide formyltransferase PurN